MRLFACFLTADWSEHHAGLEFCGGLLLSRLGGVTRLMVSKVVSYLCGHTSWSYYWSIRQTVVLCVLPAALHAHARLFCQILCRFSVLSETVDCPIPLSSLRTHWCACLALNPKTNTPQYLSKLRKLTPDISLNPCQPAQRHDLNLSLSNLRGLVQQQQEGRQRDGH